MQILIAAVLGFLESQVDPIVPFLDPKHLSDIRRFYGLAPDCPVLQALVGPRPALAWPGPAPARAG